MDGAEVARHGERPPPRDLAVVLVVVARLPDPVVEGEGRRLVDRQRRRRQVGAPLLGGELERRQVHERLEDGAGLPARGDGAVVLRLVVRAAADHGEDVAAARVDGDERGLRRLGALAPGEQPIDVGEAGAHRRDGGTLHREIQRGEDVHLARLRRDAGKRLGHLCGDEVDEVGRLVVDGQRDHPERLARGALGHVRRQVLLVRHRPQHDVPALDGALGMGERRVQPRALNDAGNERRLGQREVAHVLAEEEARRFGHAVDRERPPLPEVDVVQVQLQNLVLGGAPLEHERHERFPDLPPVGALAGLELRVELVRQEEHPRQLLRDRAVADQVPLVPEDVGHRGGEHAERVDARMRVEPLVLDRQHRPLHVGGNGRERHGASLLPSAARHQRGEERRIELDRVPRAPPFDVDALDRPGETDPHGGAAQIARPRPDGHRRALEGELARSVRLRPLGVAEVVEERDELLLAGGLSAPEHDGARKDARQRPLALAVEPFVDLPGEGNRGVPAGRHRRHGRRRGGIRRQPPPGATGGSGLTR